MNKKTCKKILLVILKYYIGKNILKTKKFVLKSVGLVDDFICTIVSWIFIFQPLIFNF